MKFLKMSGRSFTRGRGSGFYNNRNTSIKVEERRAIYLTMHPLNIMEWKRWIIDEITSKDAVIGEVLTRGVILEELKEEYTIPLPDGITKDGITSKWLKSDDVGCVYQARRVKMIEKRLKYYEDVPSAIAKIMLTLSNESRRAVEVNHEELERLKSEKDLIGVWNLIIKVHLTNNREVGYLERQEAKEAIERLTQRREEELNNFIDIFVRKVEMCENMGQELEEEFKVHTFLRALNREKFNMRVRDLMDRVHEETFPKTFEEVKVIVRRWEATDVSFKNADMRRGRFQGGRGSTNQGRGRQQDRGQHNGTKSMSADPKEEKEHETVHVVKDFKTKKVCECV